MNLCKHCSHFEDDFEFAMGRSEAYCTHPNLGPSKVHGRKMRFPCEVARKLPELCGSDGRWYMAAPELKVTRR